MRIKTFITTGIFAATLAAGSAVPALALQAQAQAAQDFTITLAPKVEYTDDKSAVIAWSTNVPSSTVMHYGTDKAAMNMTAQEQWGGEKHENGVTHRVTVKGLKPSTTYYFWVESGQAKDSGKTAGNQATPGTFQTLSVEQARANAMNVKIDGEAAAAPKDNSATITWKTTAPSSAVVKYGTEPGKLTKTAQSAWGGPAHTVEIKNLQPGTKYYYMVESGQAEKTGTSAKSMEMSFTTTGTAAAAAPAPATTSAQYVQDHVKLQAGPIVQELKDTSARIWWMTTDNTRSVVKYGTDKNNLTQTASNPRDTQHSVVLNGLTPATTYYFNIMSHDEKIRYTGQFQTEATDFAKNAKVRITKGPVIEYITQDTAIIAWTTNVRSSSVVRYGTEATNLNQTAQAPWGQETHRVTVKNLKPNTTYNFVAESAQAEGTGQMSKTQPAPFMTVAAGAQAFKNPDPR